METSCGSKAAGDTPSCGDLKGQNEVEKSKPSTFRGYVTHFQTQLPAVMGKSSRKLIPTALTVQCSIFLRTRRTTNSLIFLIIKFGKHVQNKKTAWVKMCPLNQRLEPDPPLRTAIVAPGVAWSHKHFSPYAAADQIDAVALNDLGRNSSEKLLEKMLGMTLQRGVHVTKC